MEKVFLITVQNHAIDTAIVYNGDSFEMYSLYIYIIYNIRYIVGLSQSRKCRLSDFDISDVHATEYNNTILF